ncbi:MAG: hypothetical protein KUG78_01775 [Kangiellaceae bacterium]|nr:hypothetical protein [Kangiellaceae bacterium]
MDWLKKVSSPFKAFNMIAGFIMLSFVAACGGGGGSFEDDDDGTGGGGSGGGTTVTTVAVSITAGTITSASPATVTAVVSDGLAGTVVTFSLSNSAGQLDPTSGTALTDASGTATISLSAGTAAGAGTVTATIPSGSTDSVGFATDGNGQSTFINLSVLLLDPDNNPTSNVSGASPGTLQATLTNGGVPSAGVLVTFSLNGGVGQLNPSSGTALTDTNGVASILLQSGNSEGAGTVTATVDGGVFQSIDFSVSISATDVAMTAPIISPSSIGANGTATVEVTITETTGGVTSPLSETATVQFTSECVIQGTATIDTDVDTISGVARSTYKDQGCGITDTIIISLTVGQTLLSQTGTIDVQAASAGSIEFVSATPANIALQGTGGSGRSETSTVTFRVIDSISNPVPNVGVNFSLTTSVGGLTISPDTGVEGPAQTDSNGLVDVIVQSGTIPTPVRVVASLALDDAISTVSDELVISTGVADFNSLSLSASHLAPEGWGIDGTESEIVARASDHFNNPVPDGTAISFVTEFGSIEPSCTTIDGLCSVTWTSGAPRIPNPALRDVTAITRRLGDIAVGECLESDGSDSNLNAAGLPCSYVNATAATTTEAQFFGGLGQVYGNRVSIRATILGEESFTDSNANGQFDAGEAFTDLTEAFTDDNEDSIFDGKLSNGDPATGAADVDAKCYGTGNTTECYQVGGDNEEFVDFNSNQTFDLANGLYNGVLCPVASETAGDCSRQLLTIWKNITILQAGSEANIGLIEAGLDNTDSANYFLPTTLPATIHAFIADLHNGSMPNGTVISFEAGNGKIVGPSECIVNNSSAYGINSCSVSVSPDTTSDSGPLVISVTTPNEITTISQITLVD